MEILLIRHTSVKAEKNTCYGHADLELASNYEQEFNTISVKLKDLNLKEYVFYTSPLKRCYLLANHLNNTDSIIDNRIIELNFGDWEKKNWDSIDKDILNNWLENFVTTKCPGGESFQHLYDRSICFYNELLDKKHSKVILVTHGGVIRSILAYLLGIPLNKVFSLQIDCGSITKVEVKVDHTIVSYINR